MSGERNIPNQSATDQPGFEIRIDGNTIPESVPVRSIVVTKEFNTISSATIAILDGDPSAETFEYSNSDHFVPGNNIEIKAGYQQNLNTIFKGIIVAQKLRVRENSNPVLIVECRDAAYKMTLGRKNKYFEDKKDSEIIEEILGEYSLESELEASSITHKQMVQYHSTDWDFAVMRAECNNMLLLPDDGKLIMKKPNTNDTEAFSVTFGATMIEFDGEMNARTLSESTEGKGWSYADQEALLAESENIEEYDIGNRTAGQLAGDAGFEKQVLKHAGLKDENELELWASSRQHKTANSKIRGRAKFQGTPQIKPGLVLDIQGLGARMNGKTIVWGIRHQIDEGNWLVDAQLGYEEKDFHEKFKVAQTQAGGMLPPVHGLEIGVVTAIQGDPAGEYRIKVKIPSLNNSEDGIWARIATLDAGSSRGSFFRPEIDDEVVLGFLNDDPRYPLVLGMLNSSAKPAPSENSDDNHEKGFVSRSGMKIWFNDETVDMVFETPNNNKISLSDNDGWLKVEDENGNVVLMDSSGIRLETQGDISISALGDVNIEGNNVSISANARMTASGSAGAEISSTGTTVVSGSLVQLN
jgi:Rhs element Vgr protein